MSRPRKPQQEQTPPTEGVTISIRVGDFEAEGSFSLDVWKAARTDPSPAQFIVGTLREAMEAKGYKE